MRPKLLPKTTVAIAGILFSLFFFYRPNTSDTVSASTMPKILRGHTNSVSAIDVSPNGYLIASSSLDNTVRLWNAETGETIRVFYGHNAEVYAVTFSSDNQTLASSDYSGKILIWSVEADKPLRTLQIKGWSTAVAFSPDGKQLAVANQEPLTTVFEAKTGNILRTLETTGYTNALAFSPDNHYLATGSSSSLIAIWNLQQGKAEKLLKGHQRAVKAIAFSKDGHFLASGSNDKTARIWNIKTGETEKIFQTETPIALGNPSEPFKWKMPVVGVVFSPDGKTLAIATGRAIHLYEISTKKNFQTLEGHERSVTSVNFLPDGKSLVSGSLDNTVRVWSL